MAGIGFELKKLYKNTGIMASLKAHMYSVFVTVGPIIISVAAITFMQFLLRYIGVERYRRDVLQATIMYSFIFSVILSGGYGMLLSRYLSDRLYLNKKEDILPSLYGSVSIIVVVAGLIGCIFYYISPMDTVYKLFSYLLFIGLVIQTLLGVYISAVKNIKLVAHSFAYGTVLGLAAGYVLVRVFGIDEILSVLIGFDMCILVVIVVLAVEIQQYFREKSTLYFNFIRYYDHYYLVFLTNLFYMTGLYAHNFIFWFFSDMKLVVESTYVYAPPYDLPAFYAFLSIVPTMVMFVVKVETEFYEKYNNYFYLINNGACREDIETARDDMKKTVYKELVYLMEIQLFFTIAFMILGIRLLPMAGFTASMVDLYNLLALGYYCSIIMFVVMTLLLYFDSKKSACLTALIFVLSSSGFSYVSVCLGENYYGVGFFLAGFVSLAFALYRLNIYLNNIDYYVFCIQALWKEKEGGRFSSLADKLNSIGGQSYEKK